MAKHQFNGPFSQRMYPRAHSEPRDPHPEDSKLEPGESLPIKMMVARLMQDGEVHAAQKRFRYEFGWDQKIPAGYLDISRNPLLEPFERQELQKQIIKDLKEKIDARKEEEAAKEDPAVDPVSGDDDPDPDPAPDPEPVPA